MIFNDKMILRAMKEGNKNKTTTYKLIKAKIQEFKTSPNAKEFTESVELSILNKMVAELKSDIEIFKTAKPELAEEYSSQLKYITELLPPPITEDEINKALDEWSIKNGEITQKVMGTIVKYLKEILPGVDGKLASTLIRNRF